MSTTIKFTEEERKLLALRPEITELLLATDVPYANKVAMVLAERGVLCRSTELSMSILDARTQRASITLPDYIDVGEVPHAPLGEGLSVETLLGLSKRLLALYGSDCWGVGLPVSSKITAWVFWTASVAMLTNNLVDEAVGITREMMEHAFTKDGECYLPVSFDARKLIETLTMSYLKGLDDWEWNSAAIGVLNATGLRVSAFLDYPFPPNAMVSKGNEVVGKWLVGDTPLINKYVAAKDSEAAKRAFSAGEEIVGGKERDTEGNRYFLPFSVWMEAMKATVKVSGDEISVSVSPITALSHLGRIVSSAFMLDAIPPEYVSRDVESIAEISDKVFGHTLNHLASLHSRVRLPTVLDVIHCAACDVAGSLAMSKGGHIAGSTANELEDEAKEAAKYLLDALAG